MTAAASGTISHRSTRSRSGQRIHLSENTVKSHVQEMFRKLQVRNRVDAAILASRAKPAATTRARKAAASVGWIRAAGSSE
jgi:BRCT domain type II-containing protein